MNAVRFPYTLHIWAYPNMETHIMALGFVGMPKYGHASVRSATPKYGVCRSGADWDKNSARTFPREFGPDRPILCAKLAPTGPFLCEFREDRPIITARVKLYPCCVITHIHKQALISLFNITFLQNNINYTIYH